MEGVLNGFGLFARNTTERRIHTSEGQFAVGSIVPHIPIDTPRLVIFFFLYLLIALTVSVITIDAIIDEIPAVNIIKALQVLAVFGDGLTGEVEALTPHILFHRFIRKPAILIVAQQEEQIVAKFPEIAVRIKSHLQDTIDLERVINRRDVERGILAPTIHEKPHTIASKFPLCSLIISYAQHLPHFRCGICFTFQQCFHALSNQPINTVIIILFIVLIE